MTLYQIALRNLARRKGKMAFMLLGLAIASAAVIAVISLVGALEDEMSGQLADSGSNIVITASRGELSFQYGGIVIPELVFDAAALQESDLEAALSIPGSFAITAAAPKLLGSLEHGPHHLVIAGTDLPAEFAVKPWLRFHENHGDLTAAESSGAAEKESAMEMEMDLEFEMLNLERAAAPSLENGQLALGAEVAAMLELKPGGTVELNDLEFSVLAVLEPSGTAEDSQVFMNLKQAQNLLDRPGALTIIELSADFRKTGEDALIGQLTQALPHANVAGVRQAVMARSELLQSFLRFGVFTGSLFITASIVTVFLTMSSSLRSRTREIGIFRAIGFREKNIFTIIASEVALISALGGIAGYQAGLLAARSLAPLLTGSEPALALNPLYFGSTVLATMAIGLTAGLFPIIKATRMDPAEALRFI